MDVAEQKLHGELRVQEVSFEIDAEMASQGNGTAVETVYNLFIRRRGGMR